MRVKPANIQMTRRDQLNLRLADGRKITLESSDDFFTIHMEESDGISEVVSIPLTPAAEKVGLTG
tara:strand:- start:6662 stop:6856 length:195 start_codon:yes stop_codon:yes gene_type:complete